MPVTNLQQFQGEVLRLSKDLTQAQLVTFHKKVVLEALRRVVQKTPVDTGHVRANWQVTIGVPASVEMPAASPDIGSALAALAALGPFQVVYVSNPVRYAEVLDQGLFNPADPGPSKDKRPDRFGRVLVRGGYSTQAPNGMVEVTIQELLGIFGV
jgi:hypothetical protein